MSSSTSNVCAKCDKRISKSTPTITCSHCDRTMHPKCANLSKNEASNLISLSIPWTCYDCLSDALPINAVADDTTYVPKFKVKCGSCDGWSYSRNTVQTCTWCENLVHLKCFRDTLGCQNCCT